MKSLTIIEKEGGYLLVKHDDQKEPPERKEKIISEQDAGNLLILLVKAFDLTKDKIKMGCADLYDLYFKEEEK